MASEADFVPTELLLLGFMAVGFGLMMDGWIGLLWQFGGLLLMSLSMAMRRPGYNRAAWQMAGVSFRGDP